MKTFFSILCSLVLTLSATAQIQFNGKTPAVDNLT